MVGRGRRGERGGSELEGKGKGKGNREQGNRQGVYTYISMNSGCRHRRKPLCYL